LENEWDSFIAAGKSPPEFEEKLKARKGSIMLRRQGKENRA